MENKIKLTFLAGVQVDNEIYFSAWNMNGLFKYNPQTGRCKFLKIFTDEQNIGIHSEAILYKNTIWFIPRASERITIVNLSNMNFTYLELPEYGHRPEGHIPPIRMKGYYKKEERFLWLIPYAYKLFIKIDMDKREIVSVEEWCQEGYAISIGVWIQNKLWIYVNSCNELRIIDTVSGKQTRQKMGDKNVSYVGIQKVEEWILLFPRWLKDGVILLNYNTGETKTIKLESDEQWYYEYQTLIKEGNILLIPYMGNKQVCINIKEGNCIMKESKKLKIQENVYCVAKLVYNDEIWFLPIVEENPIICYAEQEDTIRYYIINITQEKYNEDVIECITKYKIENSPLAYGYMLMEKKGVLNLFIKYKYKQNINKIALVESRIGQSIYQSII